jgi:hypothetical protein
MDPDLPKPWVFIKLKGLFSGEEPLQFMGDSG